MTTHEWGRINAEEGRQVVADVLNSIYPTFDLLPVEAQRYAVQLVAGRYAGEQVNFCGHCQTGYPTPQAARDCARRCNGSVKRFAEFNLGALVVHEPCGTTQLAEHWDLVQLIEWSRQHCCPTDRAVCVGRG